MLNKQDIKDDFMFPNDEKKKLQTQAQRHQGTLASTYMRFF